MIQGAVATIYVADFERAVRFYSETLGLPLIYQAEGHWAMLRAGDGFQIGLHATGAKTRPAGVSGSISVGLQVDDPLEERVKGLEAKGVVFRGPIIDSDPVRIASFGDPDGNDLYLFVYRGHDS